MSIILNPYRYTAAEEGPDPLSMVLRFDVDAGETITIPGRNVSTYSGTVIWGDGAETSYTTYNDAGLSHQFAEAGVYDVEITGQFPAIYFNNSGTSRLALTEVVQWGEVLTESNQTRGFYGCTSLTGISWSDYMDNLLTEGTYMFYRTGSLKSLPAGMTLDALTNGYFMFSYSGLTSLPAGMTMSALTNGSFMFRAATSLTSLPAEMTLDALTNGSSMFYQTKLTSLPAGMTLDALTNGNSMFFKTYLTSLPAEMTLNAVTNGFGMFFRTSLTSLPTGMTLGALTNGASMFVDTTINTTRYSQLLVDIESENPNNSVTFHGGGSKYNAAGGVARAALVSRGWSISDGGPA